MKQKEIIKAIDVLQKTLNPSSNYINNADYKSVEAANKKLQELIPLLNTENSSKSIWYQTVKDNELKHLLGLNYMTSAEEEAEVEARKKAIKDRDAAIKTPCNAEYLRAKRNAEENELDTFLTKTIQEVVKAFIYPFGKTIKDIKNGKE